MIRIPYDNTGGFTFEDYDLMLSVYGNRKKLRKGKTAKCSLKSMKESFRMSIVCVVCAVLLYLLVDQPFNWIFSVLLYGGGVIGLIGLVACPLYPKWLKKDYQKVKDARLKADLDFDEKGVHVWENEGKGFEKTWERFQDCFISPEYIFIFFVDKDYSLVMSSKDDVEEKVLEALRLGHREDIVVRFAVSGGKIKGLPDSTGN